MIISVVIPVHNESGNIPVLYQELKDILSTYEEKEIIIVNDGSTDNTFEICKRIHQKDSSTC